MLNGRSSIRPNSNNWSSRLKKFILLAVCLLFTFSIFFLYYLNRDYVHSVLLSIDLSSPNGPYDETILVLGGAGYIGSHVTLELLRLRFIDDDDERKKNYQVVVFDNLSEGHLQSLERIEKEILKEKNIKIPFVRGDILDMDDLRWVFRKYKPNVVMHLCAFATVKESVSNPLRYYDNNVVGSVNVLRVMKEFGVKKFVFSSTSALFGHPSKLPVESDEPPTPINPYGETKYIIENLLKYCDAAWDLKFVSLRYFNAAGADDSGYIGEDHRIETHLLPIVMEKALGYRDKLYIYGTDYDTRDGTCIRDYIHVTDIAQAHIRSIDYLNKRKKSLLTNLGTEIGSTILEVVGAAEKVSGKKISYIQADKRPGDHAKGYASSKTAERELGWVRKYNTLESIVRTAYNWHEKNPNGFEY